MTKNPLINIIPKEKNNIIKDENFSNARKNPLLLEAKSINEIILDQIKKSFDQKNELGEKDRKIVLKVIEGYNKNVNNKSLNDDEYILAKQEINEFLNLENKIFLDT